jgi:ElaB/YqjD/DUF883 family membrane-anchored ribosome-binding protein
MSGFVQVDKLCECLQKKTDPTKNKIGNRESTLLVQKRTEQTTDRPSESCDSKLAKEQYESQTLRDIIAKLHGIYQKERADYDDNSNELEIANRVNQLLNYRIERCEKKMAEIDKRANAVLKQTKERERETPTLFRLRMNFEDGDKYQL